MNPLPAHWIFGYSPIELQTGIQGLYIKKGTMFFSGSFIWFWAKPECKQMHCVAFLLVMKITYTGILWHGRFWVGVRPWKLIQPNEISWGRDLKNLWFKNEVSLETEVQMCVCTDTGMRRPLRVCPVWRRSHSQCFWSCNFDEPFCSAMWSLWYDLMEILTKQQGQVA